MKRTTFDNIKFTYNLFFSCFLMRLLAVFKILMAVFSHISFVLFPGFIIFLIEKDFELSKTIIYFLISFIIYTSVTLLSKILDENLSYKLVNERMRKGGDYFLLTSDINYEKTQTKDFKNKFELGSDSFMDDYHKGFTHMANDSIAIIEKIIILLIFLFVSTQISIYLAFFISILELISFFIRKSFVHKIRKNNLKNAHLNSKIKKIERDALSIYKAKDIRFYSADIILSSKLKSLFEEKRALFDGELDFKKKSEIIIAFINIVKYLSLFYFLIYKFSYNIDSLNFVLAFSLTAGFDLYLKDILDLIIFLKENSILIDNTRDVMDIKKEENTGNERAGDDNVVSLSNLKFSYDNKKDILKGIDLEIKKKEKIAVVGKNGAGKSTLVSILAGLNYAKEGSAKVFSLEVSENRREIRKNISAVFQDSFLYNFTLLENITLSNDCDRNKVIKLIETVFSDDDDKKKKFISLLDSEISELEDEGRNFSQGEKQSILILRALYKDGDIVILDEPTANLDAINEERVYRLYKDLFKDKTVIFVSHRMGSTNFCDRIIFLDDGKIAEEGSHYDLMSYDSNYKELYNYQKSYYK